MSTASAARTVTYLDAINRALRSEMSRDDSVFLLGEDIAVMEGAFKVTKGLLEQFGEQRVIDTPMAESAIVGASIGAALMGMRPVAEMQFADFVSCGFNQLVNNAATWHYRTGTPIPFVVRLPTGGNIAGGPFHSRNPEAWFAHQPGLKIVTPSTVQDAHDLLIASIRDDNPVLFLEHKYLYRRLKEELDESGGEARLGQAAVRRSGSDAVVFTYGWMVHEAVAVADELAAETGREVEVVDLRTLVPLDVSLVLDRAAACHRVLVLHEAPLTGGFGAEVAAIISERAFEDLDAPVKRVGALDTPVPFAAPLEEAFLPTRADIRRALDDLTEF